MISNVKKIISNKTNKIIFSNPIKNSEYHKIEIIKDGDKYKLLKYKNENSKDTIFISNLDDYIGQYIDFFKQVNIWDEEYSYNIRLSKKEKILINKSKINLEVQSKKEHNRTKNYILKEGKIIEPLVDLGIFTKEGKVINSMYDKYRQINRFLEIIDDSLKKTNLTSLNIIDFGCGKSYLTFILYYYLTEIKKVDVIKKCNEIASKYNYTNLRFEKGDIKGYKPTTNVDMVITLHACDTATDYALYNAISWGANLIFSVPCCQHELNEQIKTDKYPILIRYGIAKERFSALLTDIIRCNLLQVMGYKTQLLEFVDFENTPKNLLIRANKTNIPLNIKNKMLKEVEEIIKEYNLKPTLYTLLKKEIREKNDK